MHEIFDHSLLYLQNIIFKIPFQWWLVQRKLIRRLNILLWCQISGWLILMIKLLLRVLHLLKIWMVSLAKIIHLWISFASWGTMLKALSYSFNTFLKAESIGQLWVICPYSLQMSQTSGTFSIALTISVFFISKFSNFFVIVINYIAIFSVSSNLISLPLFWSFSTNWCISKISLVF